MSYKVKNSWWEFEPGDVYFPAKMMLKTVYNGRVYVVAYSVHQVQALHKSPDIMLYTTAAYLVSLLSYNMNSIVYPYYSL